MPRIRRTILSVACLCGAIQLAGCAGLMRQGRENARLQRVKDRTDQIVWKELVPKYEFQHSCEEVGDAVAQFLIKEGFEIATQSKTQVVTAKKWLNSNGKYEAKEYQQTTVAAAALQAAAAGCRIEITTTDAYGLRNYSARAPGYEFSVIEQLEPEKAQAMRAEAKQRAEAENPPEKAATAASAPEPEATAAAEPEKKAPVAEHKAPKAAPATPVAAEAEQAAAASEEEAPPPSPKKLPVETEAPIGLPTLEIAGAPVVALNRSLSFTDQKTNMINASEPNVRPYSLGYGPAASLKLVWYPLAAVTKGPAQHLGLEAGLQQGFFIQTTLPADDPTLPNATFNTSVHEYEGGLRYRIPFGANQAWFSATGGEHAFLFTDEPSCALSTPNTCRSRLYTPDTIYRYVRPGIGLRLELPANLAFAATVGFRYIFNGGGSHMETFFPHRTVYGLDAAVYLAYRVIPSLEIRVGGDVRRYTYAMNSTMADAAAIMAGGTDIKVAGSGVDRYFSGTIGVAFFLGGR